MVRDIDDSFLTLITNQFHLVLGSQGGLLVPLGTGRVPDPQLHGTRVTFFAIMAHILEQHGLSSIADHRVGTIKDPGSPTLDAAVDGIGPAVFRQGILVSAIQIVKHCILDSVGDTAHGLAKMGIVVLRVEGLGGETEDNVAPRYTEFLDDSAQRQEGECR